LRQLSTQVVEVRVKVITSACGSNRSELVDLWFTEFAGGQHVGGWPITAAAFRLLLPDAERAK
jgi:hypothetical protein